MAHHPSALQRQHLSLAAIRFIYGFATHTLGQANRVRNYQKSIVHRYNGYAIIQTTMSILSGVSDFFGLDIGTTAIRVVQLRGNGPLKALLRYAYVPVDPKVSLSEAKGDQQKVAQMIKDLVAQAG